MVRQDKKDITAHQVEAIAHYCQYPLQEEIEEFMESLYDFEGNKIARKDEIDKKAEFVKQHMSRAAFEKFFEEFKKQKLTAGDTSWVSLNSLLFLILADCFETLQTIYKELKRKFKRDGISYSSPIQPTDWHIGK